MFVGLALIGGALGAAAWAATRRSDQAPLNMQPGSITLPNPSTPPVNLGGLGGLSGLLGSLGGLFGGGSAGGSSASGPLSHAGPGSVIGGFTIE